MLYLQYQSCLAGLIQRGARNNVRVQHRNVRGRDGKIGISDNNKPAGGKLCLASDEAEYRMHIHGTIDDGSRISAEHRSSRLVSLSTLIVDIQELGESGVQL